MIEICYSFNNKSGVTEPQGQIVRRKFKDIDLNDPFFDSLKEDYKEFPLWFEKKSESVANVMYDEGARLLAFLFLKVEKGAVEDVEPNLPPKARMKVGTFKIIAHGTKLGERFIKRAIDETVAANLDELYLTVFEKHVGLILLIERYGFSTVGFKDGPNGREIVYRKILPGRTGEICKDFPTFHPREVSKYLLGIYPKFHTRLLPDSILDNESFSVLEDVSHANSIHKVYICWMKQVASLRKGDILIVYRTSDQPGRAWYRSVATSVCVVEGVRSRAQFDSEDDYLKYAAPHSVFSEFELRNFWKEPKNIFVIRFLYNAAFERRVNRRALVEEAGIDGEAYAGFMKLSDEQFEKILSLGGIQNRLVVD